MPAAKTTLLIIMVMCIAAGVGAHKGTHVPTFQPTFTKHSTTPTHPSTHSPVPPTTKQPTTLQPSKKPTFLSKKAVCATPHNAHKGGSCHTRLDFKVCLSFDGCKWNASEPVGVKCFPDPSCVNGHRVSTHAPTKRPTEPTAPHTGAPTHKPTHGPTVVTAAPLAVTKAPVPCPSYDGHKIYCARTDMGCTYNDITQQCTSKTG